MCTSRPPSETISKVAFVYFASPLGAFNFGSPTADVSGLVYEKSFDYSHNGALQCDSNTTR